MRRITLLVLVCILILSAGCINLQTDVSIINSDYNIVDNGPAEFILNWKITVKNLGKSGYFQVLYGWGIDDMEPEYYQSVQYGYIEKNDILNIFNNNHFYIGINKRTFFIKIKCDERETGIKKIYTTGQ